MRPIVGLTTSVDQQQILKLKSDYTKAVFKTDGLPFILAPTQQELILKEIVSTLDGLLLTGGQDPQPLLYGEQPLIGLEEVDVERDLFELKLIKLMLKCDKPIFGICRGCQILNVACGGTLYQDICREQQSSLEHKQKAAGKYASHSIWLAPNSKLNPDAANKIYQVNSFHHQALKKIPPPLTPIAYAADGVVEAVESTEHRFVIGVQWHPERMFGNDKWTQGIFKSFITAAGCSRKV
jgi:putative glutamine amidotransferase